MISTLFNSLDTNIQVFGNTLDSYLIAGLLFLVLVIVFKILQWIVLRKLARLAQKTETDIDDTLIQIVESLKPGFYYFIAFFFASKTLVFSTFGAKILDAILLAWIVYQVIIALQILVGYILEKKFAEDDDEGTEGIVGFMGGLIKAVFWIIGFLLILSNLGFDITSLVAGLGIGGLAIAFALQSVFADLFSAFSIYLDKPFKVGDMIVVGAHTGNVQKIGIKSTRIKSLQGEEIVISNQELTSARIQNFKKLQERRISSSFGVIYETSSEKLKKIPTIIKDIIEEEQNIRFDRVHFTTFADSALVFDFVYYVLSQEYSVYLVAQQNINLKIKAAFESEGIDMAYPTQTIYLQK